MIKDRSQLNAIIVDVANVVSKETGEDDYCYSEISYNNYSKNLFEIIIRDSSGFVTYQNANRKINDCIIELMNDFNLCNYDLLK